ncbi:RNA polymerase sigma factor [Streptomyces sp. 5.8]|uniref:RNA polymerase sigma factor n=1 Tax=Streptomyces sp. 5.8 TaxID=3406571 RepID=UPI003BB535E8
MLRWRARFKEEDPLDAGLVGRVRAILTLGGVPPSDLEDGVQQVRLRLLEREAGGREAPRDVGAWTAVVASHVAVDWHRSRRRQQQLSERLVAQRSVDRHGGEEAHPLTSAVGEGLEGLPPVQRQLLALRFYADLSVGQIAAHLGIPEGTVKSRLHTAVGALRRQLHQSEGI